MKYKEGQRVAGLFEGAKFYGTIKKSEEDVHVVSLDEPIDGNWELVSSGEEYALKKSTKKAPPAPTASTKQIIEERSVKKTEEPRLVERLQKCLDIDKEIKIVRAKAKMKIEELESKRKSEIEEARSMMDDEQLKNVKFELPPVDGKTGPTKLCYRHTHRDAKVLNRRLFFAYCEGAGIAPESFKQDNVGAIKAHAKKCKEQGLPVPTGIEVSEFEELRFKAG